MRVVFAEAFDGGAWPGPLAGRGAVLGESWVGPLGLLGILETGLGLSGPRDGSDAERAASLVSALHGREGPWSLSLENGADPMAVARAVLRLRDALLLAGLPPAEASAARLGARLAACVEVSRGVRVGLPERIAAVATAAARRRLDVERIELVDEPPWPALARALEVLAAQGVQVVARPVEVAPAGGDLAAARSSGFAPAGDGSLQLLRGDSLDDTAAEVAAHVAALRQGGAERVLLVSPDSALDAALARMGLPTVGARGEPGDDVFLQVAPLLVALAWHERDPERALELLSLPLGPVRRRVAHRLAAALTEQPAVGSNAWQQALAAALAGLPEGERAHSAERVAAIFEGPTAAESMPLSLLEARLSLARRWLQGRQARSADAALVSALMQVSQATRIARALGAASLSRLEVSRVLAEATAAVRPRGPRPALAGIDVVNDAGAVCGPAAHVVWWGFSAAAEAPLRNPMLSAQERAGLLAAGAELPSAAALAERRARAWARPLLGASTSLLLACSRRDARGEEQHPHPLWDEIIARAGGDEAAAPLVRRGSSWAASLRTRSFRQRDLPVPSGAWQAPPGLVPQPETESPSHRAALLGCTFHAAMERAGLRSRPRALPGARALFGGLAHEVLAATLRQRPKSAADAALLARAAFAEILPRRAATLLRPEEQTQRQRAQETIAHAAAVLVDTLVERGMEVRAVEEEIVKEGAGRAVRGRPDLVVGDPLVVVDFKSGQDRERRQALEDGVAVQLVAYAALLRSAGEPWPELAWFQVRSARLFTTSVELGGSHAIEPSHTVDESHVRFKRRAQRAECELEQGSLCAPGVGVRAPVAPPPEDGELSVPPPCDTCAWGALCGRLLPGGKGKP